MAYDMAWPAWHVIWYDLGACHGLWYGLADMTGYMVRPSEHGTFIWYELVHMAWYMVWLCGHGMVYDMASQA